MARILRETNEDSFGNVGDTGLFIVGYAIPKMNERLHDTLFSACVTWLHSGCLLQLSRASMYWCGLKWMKRGETVLCPMQIKSCLNHELQKQTQI